MHCEELENRQLAFLLHLSKERFHSRDQHICKFIGPKESVYIRKEFSSLRIGLGHQNGRRFIVLEHQYGRRDVIRKRSIITKKFFQLKFVAILFLKVFIKRGLPKDLYNRGH